ncbi:hypothetical protein A8V01_12300 [Novosphingobium guangzhouense]|uniref:Uncharacterized protein n=1 Tax=Novosphingobium guangzhouense TaxID=1850347 RepID=A0A2K2G521_9SPHN|nr:hypothetical protein A8V01_12300 [Novosphingobium guangzhouense]
MLKGVTIRSVLETVFFGKPGATDEERRNYLFWGHPHPRAEHKVILLLAMALTAFAIALIAFDADAAPLLPGQSSSPSDVRNAEPVSRIVVIAPLA